MKVARVNSYRLPILTGTGGLGGAAQYSGGGAGSPPWSYAQTDGGLVGDGVTDDTAALQAWIDSVTASGTCSGWFWFEPGTYLISGVLQDTGAFNGQILLPDVSTSDAQITLTFQGPAQPPFTVHGPVPDPQCYAILQSDLTGASGTAAVISGGNGTWPDQNNIRVVVRDLICISPPDPTMTFWNLSITQGGERRGLYITTTDWSVTPTTEPTNSNSYGIKLPQWGQTNGSEEWIMVGGHYTGILQGELAWTHAIIGQCARAIEIPFTEHASELHLHFTGCTYGIYVTGEATVTAWVDIEHYTNPPFTPPDDWLVTIADLYDVSDELIADVDWWSLDGVTQLPDHIFNVTGGANVQHREIGTPPASGVTPATTVTDETTFGITPAVGTDLEYARQDHTHGTPANPFTSAGLVGPILISDTHSTPLIFGDLLQNDDGTDLLYADI